MFDRSSLFLLLGAFLCLFISLAFGGSCGEGTPVSPLWGVTQSVLCLP